MNPRHWRLDDCVAQLAASDDAFVTLAEHGSMSLELYAPRGRDLQQPHERDEIYVIQRGSGTFLNGSERHPFEAGDVIFVAAGVTHRFEDFTEDFLTWVVFWGPPGGEDP